VTRYIVRAGIEPALKRLHRIEILATADGWVGALKAQRCELGEPDDKRRRRPYPDRTRVPGADCRDRHRSDRQRPESLDSEDHPGSEDDVFAGGNIEAGASTVILAMGHGRKAAAAIDTCLRGQAAKKVSSSGRCGENSPKPAGA
jgi:glutamate synthase (NADPH/NADH) small chain